MHNEYASGGRALQHCIGARRHGGSAADVQQPEAPAFEFTCIMPPPPPIPLADLAPGGLVAPVGYEAACNALAEALLASGHAVINLHKRPVELEAATRALVEFWQPGEGGPARRSCETAWATAR